jgi:glycine/D-amino acid oxidase-like deaminating enzyme
LETISRRSAKSEGGWSAMKTRYGLSPWIEGFPDTRRPAFDAYRGEKTVDVVIVGGGLVGCATAHDMAAAGRRPLLLEAGRVAQGSVGRSAGLILAEPGPSFRDLVQLHGLRATRIVFEAWKSAAQDAAGLIRRSGIRCSAVPVDRALASLREDPRVLRREFDSREEAGLDGAWLDPKRIQQSLRLDATGAMRSRGGLAVDPYALSLGLARAAVKKGARIFEKSPVEKVTFGAKDVEIVLRSGTLRCSTVIVTTGVATRTFKPLQRHFKVRERYSVLTEPVAATIRRQLFADDVTLRLTRPEPFRLRWAADHRLLVTGADQDETPAKRRDQVLVQRTGQLMYELLTAYPAISGLRPEFGWDVVYGETADGLMYVGPHRNYPRHLFALGGDGESIAGAFLAARLLTRAVAGASEKSDAVFGWTR